MRIGFEAKRATHNYRGLGNYARGVIGGLVDYFPEHKYFIYTPSLESQLALNFSKSLGDKAIFRTPDSKISQFMSSVWRSFIINGDLRRDNLDIFHGLSHELPFGIEDQRFKKIVTIHDLIFLRYPHFFPWIDRMVYRQKFSHACQKADRVVAICQQTKEDLVTFLGVPEEKIVIHYQSCDPQFYTKKSPEDLQKTRDKYSIKNEFFLMVGAFEERKNQKNLLEAFFRTSTYHDCDLVMIGAKSSYQDMIRQRANELAISSRVKILDSVTFDELPSFYQSSKAFCFPSFFEGFGIPIIEALFSKVPVITSLGSCFPESAGPDSLFVDPMSVEEIASAMMKVCSDQSLCEKMIEQGFKYVQKFHRENSTRELMGIYETLGK